MYKVEVSELKFSHLGNKGDDIIIHFITKTEWKQISKDKRFKDLEMVAKNHNHNSLSPKVLNPSVYDNTSYLATSRKRIFLVDDMMIWSNADSLGLKNVNILIIAHLATADYIMNMFVCPNGYKTNHLKRVKVSLTNYFDLTDQPDQNQAIESSVQPDKPVISQDDVDILVETSSVSTQDELIENDTKEDKVNHLMKDTVPQFAIEVINRLKTLKEFVSTNWYNHNNWEKYLFKRDSTDQPIVNFTYKHEFKDNNVIVKCNCSIEFDGKHEMCEVGYCIGEKQDATYELLRLALKGAIIHALDDCVDNKIMLNAEIAEYSTVQLSLMNVMYTSIMYGIMKNWMIKFNNSGLRRIEVTQTIVNNEVTLHDALVSHWFLSTTKRMITHMLNTTVQVEGHYFVYDQRTEKIYFERLD